MNLNELLTYIQTTPLTWIILTIISFKIGILIYDKSNKNTMFQPILISYIIILSVITITNTSYEEYFKKVEIIHFFLDTAVVGLALPLYKNIKLMKSLFLPIFITLICGSLFTIVSTSLLLFITHSSDIIMLSMSTKSITAPIASIIAKEINVSQSLSIGFVIITGILGALIGTKIFDIFKIKNDISKGFALGLISHVIGTSKAIEISQRAVAFSILAMILNGIFASIFLPLIYNIIK